MCEICVQICPARTLRIPRAHFYLEAYAGPLGNIRCCMERFSSLTKAEAFLNIWQNERRGPFGNKKALQHIYYKYQTIFREVTYIGTFRTFTNVALETKLYLRNFFNCPPLRLQWYLALTPTSYYLAQLSFLILCDTGQPLPDSRQKK